MVPNLSQCSRIELKGFLDSFDHVLCDCDGVLFLIFSPLQGSAECIMDFKRLGKTVKFITNNSTIPRESLQKTLSGHGIDLVKDDVINPGKAVVDCLKQRNFNKKVFLIGLTGIRKEIEDAGIQISNEYKPEILEVSPASFMKHASEELDEDVAAVVACFDFNVNYSTLNKAYRYLQDPNVLFIITGNDSKVIIGPDKFCIGPSGFQDLLMEVSGRKPDLSLGKPLGGFQDYIKTRFNYNPERTLFIGDSLEQDMQFAGELGYKKLLVLSGNTQLNELNNCDCATSLPDYYVESLGELHSLINKL